MKNAVGPVLRMGDDVEEVIAAIEDDNPGKEIEVVDRGSYVRVQGADRIVLTQDTLRKYLGQEFEIRSLGAMMSAFAGRVITTSDSMIWENIAARRAAVAGEGARA